MSEIDYEPDNKSTLEKCCKIMDAAIVVTKLKTRKVDTRSRIEEIEDKKRLRDDLALSIQ